MGLFKKKKSNPYAGMVDSSVLAQRALDFIAEGVLLVDEGGMIQFANPAAAMIAGFDSPETITGLDYQLVVRLETSEGAPVEATQTQLYAALMTNQAMTTRDYAIISAQTDRRMAISLSVIPTGGVHDFKIITFRDITKELAEENEQAEFISTASHEMRTPVASIEGYLGLALNPQTATIDARAHQYLEAAHAASQHLGNLFKDLLDVTKLDDKRLKAHLVPVEAKALVQQIVAPHESQMQAKNLTYSFGVEANKHPDQGLYMAVDLDFIHEVIDNLVGNAIKYTPEGGNIAVDVQGSGDKIQISVKDTGIGISAEDAAHVFQKFYRVDNSQTRQIGGTGLGLYLVKKRVEAMGGKVWVESEYGKGSTFYAALPRLSDSDYEKMSIALENEKMVQNFSSAEMQGDEAAAAAVIAAAQEKASEGGALQGGVVSTVAVPDAEGEGGDDSGAAGVVTNAALAAAPIEVPTDDKGAPTEDMAAVIAAAGGVVAGGDTAGGSSAAGTATVAGSSAAGTGASSAGVTQNNQGGNA